MQPITTSLVGGILPFGAVLQSCSGEQNLMLCFCIAGHVAPSAKWLRLNEAYWFLTRTEWLTCCWGSRSSSSLCPPFGTMSWGTQSAAQWCKYTVSESTCKLYLPRLSIWHLQPLAVALEVLLLVWLLIPGAAHSPDHLCGNLHRLDLLSANLWGRHPLGRCLPNTLHD